MSNEITESKAKRASPVPTDETQAIRALREVRKIDAAVDRIKADLKTKLESKVQERAEVLKRLTPAGRLILDRQLGTDAPSEDIEVEEEA